MGVVREARRRKLEGGPQDLLRKAKYVAEGFPTYGALLLFGNDPQSDVVQSVVKCARFKGIEPVDFLDERTLYGDLFSLVEDATEFVLRHIEKGIEFTGRPQRTEKWQYPPQALREALINAVCHRDYQDTGSVQLRIFDDRLEVWNPGALPAPLTVEDLKRPHDSLPRNPRVADAFFQAGFIEAWGSGTLRMID